MKKHFFSSIKITIKTLNQEQIFDKLIKKNIKITNLKRKNNFETSFFIEAKNHKETIKVLKTFNAEICEQKTFGLALAKQTFFNRIGVFVASVCVIIFFVVVPNFFVLNTKIMGNSFLKTPQICQFLEKNYNIKNFSAKSSINIPQLELDLVNNFKEISMANVMIKGSTLVVNIKEKSEAEILAISSQDSQNLISNFNGRILELSQIRGTAKVKVGDIVKQGDILVEGCQENVVAKNTKAQAKITAEVWIEKSFTHNPSKIVVERTGKTQKQNEVSFLGINVFNDNHKCSFENFEKEEKTSKLKNTILPLNIKTTIYYEITQNEEKSNYQDVREDILTQCKENALQDLLEGDIIKNEKVMENAVGDLTTLTYLMVVERHLG